jgi:hypothetical protein
VDKIGCSLKLKPFAYADEGGFFFLAIGYASLLGMLFKYQSSKQ